MVVPSSAPEIEKILTDDYGLSFSGIDLPMILNDLVESGRLKLKNGKYSK